MGGIFDPNTYGIKSIGKGLKDPKHNLLGVKRKPDTSAQDKALAQAQATASAQQKELQARQASVEKDRLRRAKGLIGRMSTSSNLFQGVGNNQRTTLG